MKSISRRNIRVIILALSLPIIILLNAGWGGNGHETINRNGAQNLPAVMNFLPNWPDILADHASDADDRKGQDPAESPKHYIDIDNYDEFIADGKISPYYDSLCLLHGASFVDEQGLLPWATLTTYDSLVACFSRKDWDKAALFASDLGHYVADGHMPLHITKNYNGQFSNQTGVHSRYESSMINDYIGQINFTGKIPSLVNNIRGYIFSYIYSNYPYVDSVLKADLYAKNAAGNTSSALYYSKLWERSRYFTNRLFTNASIALSELIFTAWAEAGYPNNWPEAVKEYVNDNLISIVINQSTIALNVKTETPATTFRTEVFDLQGKVIARLTEFLINEGTNSFSITISNQGVYLLKFRLNNKWIIQKVCISN